MIDFEKLSAAMVLPEPPALAGEGNATDPLPGNEDSPHDVESDSPVFTLPQIVDSADFMGKAITPSKQLIHGLVHQGTKVIIGGSSKSFKTWNQLDINVCIAYGIPWLGFETAQGRVLFVNFEVQEEFFQFRLGKILEARGRKLERKRMDIWNLRGFSAPYGLVIPRIIERIKNEGYSLVNLDPIYKLYGAANENSASEIAGLMNSLETVCVQTASAVLFGAHYSKGNQAAKDSIDRVSGSGVFARDPDSIIPFTNHEERGSFVVEPTLRNLPPVDPFVVTWNFPLMERNDILDPAKIKQARGAPSLYSADTILSLLKEGPLSLQNWQEIALKKHGISRATFFRLKLELKSHDLIMYSRINDTWVALNKQRDRE